ncbi:MAG: hypothetical protein M9894_17885 [Planctomycetes bacterium]|nr:hypothetical protein [Planctomycetota bacterium]
MSAGLGAASQVAIAVSGAGTALAGALYHRRQNRPGARLGGAISRAKAVWLAYAVFLWFFLAPILALSDAVAPPARALLGAFAAFMWLRGVLELVLLFWTRSWTPPMGIAHDLACLVLLAGGGLWLREDLAALDRSFDRWTLALLAAVAVSLVCEVIYALTFHRLVGGRTKGDEAVWFAPEDDPTFRAINRLTAALNAPQVVFLLLFLGVCFDAL